MEVQELKQLMKQGNIPKFMIFTGEEYQVQKIYIKQIAKVKGLSVYYVDSIDDIWGKLKSSSLFKQDYVYVIKDDKELMTNEKIYTQLENVLNNNVLILQLTSADKRLKILKTYKSNTIEFNPLNSTILRQYIKKEITLSDKNCDILMDICEYNYGRCLLEIDKIRRYVNYLGPAETQDGVFQKFISEGTIHIPPKDTLWDFIKAFLQNKPLKAYELYQDLKELESPTLAILSNLYNNTKQVFQVQTCKSDNVEKSTGLTGWQIKNAKECVGKLPTGDLAFLLRLIQKVETDIKTGNLEEGIAIDYIFTAFF